MYSMTRRSYQFLEGRKHMMAANLTQFCPFLMFTVSKSLTQNHQHKKQPIMTQHFVFNPPIQSESIMKVVIYTANEIQNDAIKCCVHVCTVHTDAY